MHYTGYMFNDYAKMLDTALDLIGYDELESKRADAEARLGLLPPVGHRALVRSRPADRYADDYTAGEEHHVHRVPEGLDGVLRTRRRGTAMAARGADRGRTSPPGKEPSIDA